MVELKQLRQFIVLSEELHFGRAATRLHITQPGLSQQIRKLEKEVAVALMDRSTRHVTLTTAGEGFRLDALGILAAAEAALLNARNVGGKGAGKVRLAFVGSGAFGILPSLLRRFHTLHPRIRIQYHDDHIHYPFDLIEGGLLDVAIVRAPVTHPRLAIETFLREPLVAVLPSTHPLAERRSVRLGDLRAELFAFFPRRNAPEFYDAVMTACVSAGFSPHVEYEASDWQVIASIVASGLAIALAPASVQRMPREGLEYRMVKDCKVRAELAVVYNARRLNPEVKAFLAVASQTDTRSR